MRRSIYSRDGNLIFSSDEFLPEIYNQVIESQYVVHFQTVQISTFGTDLKVVLHPGTLDQGALLLKL